ncbi:MAG: aldehyde ferredoxin oxidoreductase N-terminal domain-containing protein [Candidatus Lernaella stagnicola]|nr:aldehyde ferredoxin oxidoreductase N-terminal domain-containing protein [Candidatus Lernaella stagnicola]
MLKEMSVYLDDKRVETSAFDQGAGFGKALAARRIMEADSPDDTVYFSGFTPLAATGLGFAGKLNVYGISLLGGNLQGSRSGGLITRYLTRQGIAGIGVVGQSETPLLLHVDAGGEAALRPLAEYGEDIVGTYALAEAIYRRHGNNVGMAITDPASMGFLFNAILCNARPGDPPHRVAGRGTTRFGSNGLVGIVVERSAEVRHGMEFDKARLAETLRALHKAKWNTNLTGSDDPEQPLLGGTYGAAAKGRFDGGHGLTNLFRAAHLPPEHYAAVLPESLVRDQIRLAEEHGLKISRHSCLPGCPNKCSQVVILPDNGEYKVFKAGEWETYQGVLNLGLFADVLPFTTWVTQHSNDHAYDHIEGLVTLAAFALATETKADTGVRYGDTESMRRLLHEAIAGDTERGRLFRRGAAAVEEFYGLPRHFTVGGHALPFHNGRSMLQTGVGLSWTYGRHGECCAGPGRHNFLDQPYDPTDHALPADTHVLNTMHGIAMYGAVDELGMCFFIGPSLDTLVDCERILAAAGRPFEVGDMVRVSAALIRDIHDFNKSRGVEIQALPQVFYDQPTHGNAQSEDEAVCFNVPFEAVRDTGAKVLEEVAAGKQTIPDRLLTASRARYE